MSLKLTNKQLQGLHRALYRAFPDRSDLEQMTFFELDQPLNEIVGPGNIKDNAFELVTWANSRGKLEDLISGASSANSDNPDLKAFVLEVGLFANSPPEPDGLIQHQLQSLVVSSGGVADTGAQIEIWKRRAELSERSVCRLEDENAQPVGTGFLVASDVVMTNAHVSEELRGTNTTPQARFDYLQTDQLVNGQATPLASSGWEIASSPPTQLDYALLKLSTPVGDTEHQGEKRGWLEIDNNHKFVKDEPILIVHHPGGNPLEISVGYLRDLNQTDKRIAYTVNTQGGSSGAPCFDMFWNLVAIHHQGDAFTNHGIPMDAIKDHLQQQGLGSF